MLCSLNIMYAQERGPSTQLQMQNGPSSDELDIQRRHGMEKQQQQQHYWKSPERRISATEPTQPLGHPPSAARGHVSGSRPPPMGSLHLSASRRAQGNGLDRSSMSVLAISWAETKMRRAQQPKDDSGGSSPHGTSKFNAKWLNGMGSGGGLVEEINQLLAKRRKAASGTDKPADKKKGES